MRFALTFQEYLSLTVVNASRQEDHGSCNHWNRQNLHQGLVLVNEVN